MWITDTDAGTEMIFNDTSSKLGGVEGGGRPEEFIFKTLSNY